MLGFKMGWISAEHQSEGIRAELKQTENNLYNSGVRAGWFMYEPWILSSPGALLRLSLAIASSTSAIEMGIRSCK